MSLARSALVVLGTLAVLAMPSYTKAAGINLFWNDCSLGPAATTNRTFACNVNTGVNDLYASFDPPDVTEILGNEVMVDVQSGSAVLPDWWQFKNSGSCRQTSLSAITAISGTCTDPWLGSGVSGIAAYLVNANTPSFALNRARIIGVASIPGCCPVPVNPGTEYFSLLIRINNSKTVQTGSCDGCLAPVCLVLQQITLQPPAGTPGGNTTVTNPLASHYVTWQGGAIGGAGCPGATPALNRTWGAIKSAYR